MGIRINKRLKIAPGVSINLSKTGPSLSLGRPGANINIGPRGTRTTVGLPGSGISYVTQKSWGSYTQEGGSKGSPGTAGRQAGAKAARSRGTEVAQPAASGWAMLPSDHRVELSYLERLVLPANEEALIEGCRELLGERENAALSCFERAASLADGAFMAGATALRLTRYDRAVAHLTDAAQRRAQLGRSFARHGFVPQLIVPVTDEVAAIVGPDIRGVLLALSEAYQLLWRWEQALDAIVRLRKLEPHDPVLQLAQMELILSAKGENRAQLEQLLSLSSAVENKSPVHSAIMLYRARAQRALDLPEAARDTLNVALRRKAGRPPELLNAIRYERAELYHELGNTKKAREDYEEIYANDPEFMDVAVRKQE